MAKPVIVDFKGADPVSGGRRFDRIPEGTYLLRVAQAKAATTSTNKPMLVVTLKVAKGDYKGKQIGDWMVISGKMFSIQLLHGFMVACGLPQQTGRVALAKIAKAVTGKSCVAEVADSIMGATDDRKEMTVSAAVAYHSPKSKAGVAALKNDKDEEDEEDEDESDEEDEEDEDEEEEKPKKVSKKAKSSDDGDDDEDLYEDEDEDEDEEEAPKKAKKASDDEDDEDEEDD